MYGNATYINVNQPRHDSFSQKYQRTSGQVFIALVLMVYFSSCIALVSLLLTEYQLKCMFKEPTIRNSNQFRMFQAMNGIVGKSIFEWTDDKIVQQK